MIELFVEGNPATAGSLKWMGGDRLVHDSDRTKTWEDWIRWIFIQSKYHRGLIYMEAVQVEVRFQFKRPAGHYKKNGSLTAEGKRYPYPSHKGKRDLDKLQRAAFDALTSYVYDDDGRICKITAEKVWAEEEGMYIKIEEIK